MKTNKDLKEEYKQKRFRIGVFQIRNTVNNKIFVEGSVNLDAIWNRHRVELNFGNHRNLNLQKDWNEVGEALFKFEILSEMDQDEDPSKDFSKELKTLTGMFIEELQPFGDKGYNG